MRLTRRALRREKTQLHAIFSIQRQRLAAINSNPNKALQIGSGAYATGIHLGHQQLQRFDICVGDIAETREFGVNPGLDFRGQLANIKRFFYQLADNMRAVHDSFSRLKRRSLRSVNFQPEF